MSRCGSVADITPERARSEGCRRGRRSQAAKMADEWDIPMKVEILVFEGCPHAGEAMTLVREVVGRLAPAASVDRVDVDTPEKAAVMGFLGSPSVRVNGEDIERRSTRGGSLCCRTYAGE